MLIIPDKTYFRINVGFIAKYKGKFVIMGRHLSDSGVYGMLKLVLGRAGSGKTSQAMGDLKSRMDKEITNLFFIVPEQYSHDAERQLLRSCGDRLSLHGEVKLFAALQPCVRRNGRAWSKNSG